MFKATMYFYLYTYEDRPSPLQTVQYMLSNVCFLLDLNYLHLQTNTHLLAFSKQYAQLSNLETSP